ncbi:hypothetical protein [Chroococcidiopsis cubana]|uniref:hypothetical protein n=1 Tax=Chroococcidiopsis cubana TaxID=171392 RepID=UPI002ACECA01|nr:hypothetical protein [Chroococcidiopsis cubana]
MCYYPLSFFTYINREWESGVEGTRGDKGDKGTRGRGEVNIFFPCSQLVPAP